MTDLSTWILENNVADYASVIALVITIFGFGITIFNTWRSKRAAEHAEQAAISAAQKVSERIATINVVEALSTLISTTEEIKRLHASEEWKAIQSKYATVRKALIEIRPYIPDSDKTPQSSIQGAITFFRQAEDEASQMARDPECRRWTPRLSKALLKHTDSLQEIFANIKSDMHR